MIKRQRKDWHSVDAAVLFEFLSTGENGLSNVEALERLHSYGPNKLPEQKPLAVWQIVQRQFYSPLNYILVRGAQIRFCPRSDDVTNLADSRPSDALTEDIHGRVRHRSELPDRSVRLEQIQSIFLKPTRERFRPMSALKTTPLRRRERHFATPKK